MPFEVEVLCYRSYKQGSGKTHTLKLWIQMIVDDIAQGFGR